MVYLTVGKIAINKSRKVIGRLYGIIGICLYSCEQAASLHKSDMVHHFGKIWMVRLCYGFIYYSLMTFFSHKKTKG